MPDPIVLRRSLGARLFSGFWLQPILSLATLLTVGLYAFLADAVGSQILTPQALLSLVPIVVWAFGVAGYARADDRGVRWRLFRTHAPAWSDVELVRFASVITAVPGAGTRPAIFVRTHGVEHPIVPAYDVNPRDLAAFADGLTGLAAAHGVPARSESAYWDRIGASPALERAPHVLPGRVVSHDLHRLRMRLTGLAFLVVTACAWAGAFAGWETPGTGERVAFGIVGLVLLPIGLLLIAFPSS